jgi:hypothetical protein
VVYSRSASAAEAVGTWGIIVLRGRYAKIDNFNQKHRFLSICCALADGQKPGGRIAAPLCKTKSVFLIRNIHKPYDQCGSCWKKAPHRERYTIVFNEIKEFLNMPNLQELPTAIVVQWGESGRFSAV